MTAEQIEFDLELARPACSPCPTCGIRGSDGRPMTLNLRMAWRNLWRHKRRTWLTATAMIFSNVLLVFMISLQFGSYDMMIDNTLKSFSGHLAGPGDRLPGQPEVARPASPPSKHWPANCARALPEARGHRARRAASPWLPVNNVPSASS